MPPPRAVLETSFWVAACRAEVAANLLDLFGLVVPAAVEAELLATDPDYPTREYAYATLFRQLRGRMEDQPEDAPPPLPQFHSGEAAAISLAQYLTLPLLVNERKAAAYARNHGLMVFTVPMTIVDLRAREVVSDRAARRKLELIASMTSPAFIAEALSLLSAYPPH